MRQDLSSQNQVVNDIQNLNQQKRDNIKRAHKLCKRLYEKYIELCEKLDFKPEVKYRSGDLYILKKGDQQVVKLKEKREHYSIKRDNLVHEAERLKIWISCLEKKFERNKSDLGVGWDWPG